MKQKHSKSEYLLKIGGFILLIILGVFGLSRTATAQMVALPLHHSVGSVRVDNSGTQNNQRTVDNKESDENQQIDFRNSGSSFSKDNAVQWYLNRHPESPMVWSYNQDRNDERLVSAIKDAAYIENEGQLNLNQKEKVIMEERVKDMIDYCQHVQKLFSEGFSYDRAKVRASMPYNTINGNRTPGQVTTPGR